MASRRDVDPWFDQAEEDLETARYNFEGGRYPYAAFLAHQAVEKALKAILLSRGGSLRKIHDLVLLARDVDAPEAVVQACERLNPHYIATRYPVGVEARYDEEDAEAAVGFAEVVLDWVREAI